MHTHDKFCMSAIIYAERYSFAVFPVGPDKRPLLRDWYNEATLERKTIERLWNQHPSANVGVATGSRSSILVLDVDVKGGANGLDSLRDLEGKYGQLPITPCSLTPSGGLHYFFRYSGPRVQRRIKFLDGLDLMAEGSQVLLPPSVGVSGQAYCWEISSRITDVPFAAPPAWLLEVAQQANNTVSGGGWQLPGGPSGIVEGSRNQTVASIAGHLLRRFVHPPLVKEMLLALNARSFKPPLTEDEVIRTIDSIASKELKRRQLKDGLSHGN